VARLASLPLAFGLRIEAEDLGVPRMGEMCVVVDVADDALAVADVRSVLRERRSRLQSGDREHRPGGSGPPAGNKRVPSPYAVAVQHRHFQSPGRWLGAVSSRHTAETGVYSLPSPNCA
jgi:hypothetical protein